MGTASPWEVVGERLAGDGHAAAVEEAFVEQEFHEWLVPPISTSSDIE